MRAERIPITDDHIHIDPRNGRGIEAAKEFRRAGGTHIFLVSKPSWSCGVEPASGAEYGAVFEYTLSVAERVREAGVVAFAVLGVHPAEITRLSRTMPLPEAAAAMRRGLEVAAAYVREGRAVGLKSGRPHYPVPAEVWDASNGVLRHALALAADCGCALQVHAESGPCADIVGMAESVGMDPGRVVKHFAVPETPLVPSLIARHEGIADLALRGRRFTMESDYMDETSRPGAVLGPKSVPRATNRLLAEGRIGVEEAWRIHADTPAAVYGVEIAL